ncbi:xanthine dehydrogenase/oxidase-like [Periophthalmus magnuspinnatus]|uniref:xanthine dehydrogenase/oxidase-like n=1 Tax=Periophthalmus magnuspinnatus TaxID=409849 RepID=UPI00145BE1B6|nr:xanthine dehydrogenase/oxidase-like [Periophthalmus magnuspinnatus]
MRDKKTQVQNGSEAVTWSGSDELIFFVNGKKVVEKNPDPEMTLLFYLRRKLGLTGTKLGCAEGGCGACTVMISRFNLDSQRPLHLAVNACLAPLCSLHLAAVTTVEGIGSTARKLHPVQERISHAHGSQCGFCTPGLVMSMYALLRNNPTPHMEQLHQAFQGNLCRCTGYRPILEGFKTFTLDGSCGAIQNGCQTKDLGLDQDKVQNGSCCKGRADSCCMNRDQGLDQDLDRDSGLTWALFDPSEFMPFDPTQEVIFPPELISLTRSGKSWSLVFRSPRCTWFQPVSLDQLLDLKWTHPESRIVVGNTEVGIEVKFKNMVYPVLISPTQVPELNSVQHTETGIEFGAAVTLDRVEAVLQDAVISLPACQTEVFRAVLEQLRWFAGKQIRNVAALGGNIMTASPISDINPVLMSTGAKLTLRDREGVRVLHMDQDFFTGYRRTAVRPAEVLVSAAINYSRQGQIVRSYKTSRRREDDISIVTATFNVIFEPGSSRVHDLRLAFGGMGPTTVLTPKTSNALRGRLWGEELLQIACSSLADEMTLDPSCPGGMVSYRRTLVLSLFYKFYLSVLQTLGEQGVEEVEPVPSEYLSATEVFHPPVPSSVQVYQTVPSGQDMEDVVGRPLMHVSAEQQATGEAQYCDDLTPADNELYLSLICSTRAHAKILSIDCSEARAMPSVVCVLFAEDVPGSNGTGPVVYDETVLAQGEVTCVGHVIGAVVAETQGDAQRAAKSVKIQYQDLPAVITIQDAIEAQSFYEPIRTLQKGDLETGFNQSDHILEGELHMGGQEHFYLETNVTVAVPRDQDEIEIFSSTQSPSKTQSLVARALGISSNRVHVRVKRMGGGFGGKESRTTILSTVVALAAHRLKRPVRCMLDRDEDMLVTGGRHPFYSKYKVGFSESGQVLALDVTYYSNAGNSMDLSMSVMDRALMHLENSYLVPNVRGRGIMCQTHLPSNTAFRGFGGPQGMMVCEDWISAIALKLGRTSEQVLVLFSQASELI